MRKFTMFILTIAMVFSITACGNNTSNQENTNQNNNTSSMQGNGNPNGNSSSGQGSSSQNGNTSSGQGNSLPNGGSSQGQGDSSQSGSVSPNQGNRQPNSDQQIDTYYSIDDLIELVKQAGSISGSPESLDVSDIGAVKGVAYGNVVFLDYEFTDSQEFNDACAANKVTVNGKDAKIGALNGPYVMAFFDNNVDQNAVEAFHALGFGA